MEYSLKGKKETQWDKRIMKKIISRNSTTLAVFRLFFFKQKIVISLYWFLYLILLACILQILNPDIFMYTKLHILYCSCDWQLAMEKKKKMCPNGEILSLAILYEAFQEIKTVGRTT